VVLGIYICVLFVHICPVTYPEKRPDDLLLLVGNERTLAVANYGGSATRIRATWNAMGNDMIW
jgi:hypothetical protein